MSASNLPEAPGARAAKICGILAILFALTCVGFPVALVLGIIALVKQGQAKKLAKAQPEAYRPVPATALVTGIIGLVLPVFMLPVVGIASAIAIPAFLGQRDRAREIVVKTNLEVVRAQAEAAVMALQEKCPDQVPSPESVLQSLTSDPIILALKNPYTPSAPALQCGRTGPAGTVMVFDEQEQQGGITSWSFQFRAVVRRGGQERTIQGEVITHTQERP